jgi:hypothetical protein
MNNVFATRASTASNSVSKTNTLISGMSLLTDNNKLRSTPVSASVSASVPVPAPVPAPVVMRGGADTELLAKNTQLQHDLTAITAKYNTLVNYLRSAGVLH